MSLPILDQFGPKPHPMQPLVGALSIARGRVHEFCGPARVALAALLLGQTDGPVIWINPGWQAERLYPPGLRDFADPSRIIFARARRPEDLLWAMEESLRSGAAPLVVAELMDPPALTPVRRLHLAAEAGAEAARHRRRPAPLGVLLTRERGGAAGVESRWHMAATPTGSSLTETGLAWRLDRLRARRDPPAAWSLMRDAKGGIALEPATTDA
ncbi:MAG: hypothetical protein V4804_05735 [Pseudomonadota bacterium]